VKKRLSKNFLAYPSIIQQVYEYFGDTGGDSRDLKIQIGSCIRIGQSKHFENLV